MKNDGFTLFETLVWLLVICFFAIIAINMGKKTFATSITSASELSDNDIYLATEAYIEDGNVGFDSDYFCISTSILKSSGYLKNPISKNKYVEVRINKTEKVVEEMYFVKNCN